MLLLASMLWPDPAVAADAPPATAITAEPGPVRYDRDIRPLLSDRCFVCHGPDQATRRAGLRLDERDVATADRDGITAVVPGNPEASELWVRIQSDDWHEQMPPPTSAKRRLNDDERELLRRWIAEGAVYEPHWSFVEPLRSPVPAVTRADWPRTPLDHFILAELERRDVSPSPEAAPATLARRIYLELTGLPPTPEERDAFIASAANSPSGDAVAALVNRLLSDEPYLTRHAERMAVPWLDAARFADTSGIHMDAGRQTWLWRDWVIDAYRRNLPFDRFVIEQLAGDLLPDATDSQRIATGFNRQHVTSDEGGAIAEEYLVEYAVDRASTTASAFLGLTMGCARCHDHKFDPISQQEFYSFYSFFNSIEEPGLYSQTPDPMRAHEPFLVVPTEAQAKERAAVRREIEAAAARMATLTPEEAAQRAAFMRGVPETSGVRWATSALKEATSTEGATLRIQPDGSALAAGKNPASDEHHLVVRTEETGLRLLLLEALADPTLAGGRLGRAPNGNAVVSAIVAEAISVTDPTQRRAISLGWAWADVEQSGAPGEPSFSIANVLDSSDATGWALDGHRIDGGRVALLLAEEPFGFDGGTDVHLRIAYRSPYAQHALGRVRVRLGAIDAAGLAMLPPALGPWHVVGPFLEEKGVALFDARLGPEEGPEDGPEGALAKASQRLDLARNFGAGNQYWRIDSALRDGHVNGLANGRNLTYVGRQIYSPDARALEVSLGSDDGLRVFVNGTEHFSRNIERSARADSDCATLPLVAGPNAAVLKIVNTGGDSGFYFRTIGATESRVIEYTETGALRGDLVAALLPADCRSPALEARLESSWRSDFLPADRARRQALAALTERNRALESAAPRTMVMRELDLARETFVLDRGLYDKPNRARPVARAVPAALGALADGAPRNRLGLAQWIMSEENPLTARVAVNRLWEMVFGTGLVSTSEDFGHQGEWPSHPELLDYLAVEFEESGWDVRHMLRLMVTSATFRQSSVVRIELKEIDPFNRLLSFYPRRRLGAEQIRDQALHLAGLLVERAGGASVKPYQPDGLWQEVSMPGSNTRVHEPGIGDALWRRSLYTYWKRAAPPPSLLTFDAPTREACTIRRTSTNTPLQALVLWNDVQYVEAARVLAERTLREQGAIDDASRINRLFTRVTSRTPDEFERTAIQTALSSFRERYRTDPDAALAFISQGAAPRAPAIDPSELAAWTMISSSLLNLHTTLTQE